jgi:hypothetical protein
MDTSDIFLMLHLLTLSFVAWTVFRADHMGFDWMRGKIDVLDAVKVHVLHRNTWIGLCGMILTGFLMFWPMREYLLIRPQFYTKMAFVITLILNGFVIGYLQKVALVKAYAELTTKEKLPLMISGAISTIGWLGAATTAFFLLPD